MRVCIFGGRDIDDRALLERAMANAAEKGIVPTVVVCGMAPGLDTLGRRWAEARGLVVEPYPALWDDLDAPGAVVRYRRDGQPYNAKAGPDRNRRMGERADAGVCCWDGKSPGSKSMIEILRSLGKPVHVELIGEATPGLFD